MLKNHLKIAWRHLIKNKYISIINFIGLVVGMTAVLFIWQYVVYEKSYDKFHEHGERIVRVRTDRVKDGVPFMQFAAGAACAGPVISRNFPSVENYVKLVGSGEALYSTQKDVVFQPENVFYAMPSFFEVFSFPLLEGDPKTCLQEPFTACISETTAKKMFGDENPIGKLLTRNDADEYRITGILKDAPQNSHLKFDILLSYITYSDVFNENGETETAPFWDGYLTYLLLKPQTDWQALEAKIPNAMEKTYDKETSEQVVFYLQPFEDIHLTSDLLFETEPPGDKKAVNFLFMIGSFVLLIAWFNYVNLSTARSELRAKEVGVRKVVGSGRRSLMAQFMTEAALMNLLAMVVAFGLAQFLSPWFTKLIDQPIPMDIFGNTGLFLAILGVFLLGTFLTGLYPAFLLSSFKPMEVLKTGLSNTGGAGGNWMRKSLVVLQFIASAGLIACTIIIYHQLNYMQDKSLGLDIEQTLVIRSPLSRDSTFMEKAKTFEAQLEDLAAVKSSSGSTSVPGQPFGWTAGIAKWGTEEYEGVHAIAADFDYAEAYGIEVIAGRTMTREMGSDLEACIMNEKALEVFQFATPEEALGADLNFWGDRLKVIGVVKNFHQESPKTNIEPMVMRVLNDNYVPRYFSLKLATDQIGGTVAQVESIWSNLFAGNPLDYFFLDDHYDQQYRAERLFGRVFTVFAGLAIFISCLGLFALVAFVAERRKKEMGIRKVLGASAYNIVYLLSKDFLVLVVGALVIAIPVVWYFMNQWLENFTYHIDIQWWVFLLAGAAAISIAFLTVSFQSMKAAIANPVESLRSE